MTALRLSELKRIRERLQNIPLENLIAVFSRAETDDVLLVYAPNADLPSEESVETIYLQELPSYQLGTYKGLVFGFTALDLIRSDINTKGGNFYPLARLFAGLGQADELIRTRASLAQYLWGLWKSAAAQRPFSWSLRLSRKLTELAIPPLIAAQTIRNLAAIFVYDIDLLMEGNATFVYLNDPPSSSPKVSCVDLDHLRQVKLPAEGWVISFEEMALLDERISPLGPQFIELRQLLRTAAGDAACCDVTRSLARQFHESAHDLYSEPFEGMAYALATESWLNQSETDDLVALVPGADWEAFVEHGACSRYYRTLPESNSPNAREETGHFLFSRLQIQSHADVRPAPWIAVYGVLRNWIEGGTGSRWIDLSSIIWKAGYENTVARTSFLHSRDLLDMGGGPRERRGIHLEQVSDLAARACAIYGLSNPWDWEQGRHMQFVQNAYHNLIRTLDSLVATTDPPINRYYGMLRAWYGCYEAKPQRLEMLIQEWVDQGNQFIETLADIPDSSFDPSRRTVAEHLVDLGEAIQDILSSSRQSDGLDHALKNQPENSASRVFQTISQAAASNRPLQMPSSLFYNQLGEIRQCIEAIIMASGDKLDVQNRVGNMKIGCQDLERVGSTLFAEPHETAILEFICNGFLMLTRELMEKLATGASIQSDVLNDEVSLHQRSIVTFRLKNIGTAPAPNVQATLSASETFDFAPPDLSPDREIGDIAPGQTREITFAIIPRDEGDVQLCLNFIGYDQDRKFTFPEVECRIPVRSLDEHEFKPKDNPYTYGPPIQTSRFFFGRSVELSSILATLVGSGRQNIVIRGPRRTGKTSLLYMLHDIFENAAGVRERFDISPDWYQDLDLMRPLLFNLQGIKPSQGEIDTRLFFDSLIPLLAQLLGWSETHTDDLREYYDSLRDFGLPRQVRGVLMRLEQSLPQGVHIVVLLDEFDLLSSSPDKGILDFLRSILMEYQWITWILASATGVYKDIKSYESPFFNQFKLVNLEDLGLEDAKRLVVEPSQDLHLVMLSEAVNEMFRITHGHPYFLQLICSEVIEEVNRRQTNYVTYDLVQDVIKKVVEPGQETEDNLRYLWETASPLGQLILALLSRARTPLSLDQLRHQIRGHIQPREFSTGIEFGQRLDQSLRWLEDILEAVSHDEHNRYSFSRPLFAMWFEKQDHLIDQALDGILRQSAEGEA